MARPKKKVTTEAVEATTHPMNKQEVILEIEGIGPGYISNNFPESAKGKIEGTQTKKGGARALPPRDPKQEYEESLRLDEKGRPCIPGSGIKAALIDAAPAVDLYKTFVSGVLHVLDDLIPIENSKPNMRRDHVKFGGKLAYRAFFKNEPNKPWRARFRVMYDANRISASQLADLVNAAGFSVGIGALRPQKRGYMGMFQLTLSK